MVAFQPVDDSLDKLFSPLDCLLVFIQLFLPIYLFLSWLSCLRAPVHNTDPYSKIEWTTPLTSFHFCPSRPTKFYQILHSSWERNLTLRCFLGLVLDMWFLKLSMLFNMMPKYQSVLDGLIYIPLDMNLSKYRCYSKTISNWCLSIDFPFLETRDLVI